MDSMVRADSTDTTIAPYRVPLGDAGFVVVEKGGHHED
jgi:hypothetical protein